MHRDVFNCNRHRGPEEWWSSNATIEDWFDEMVGLANIINKYAAVRLEDIKGRYITRYCRKKLSNLLENNRFKSSLSTDRMESPVPYDV